MHFGTKNQGGLEAARFILAESEELTANSRARIKSHKREQEFAFLFHVEQLRSVASCQRFELLAQLQPSDAPSPLRPQDERTLTRAMLVTNNQKPNKKPRERP